MARTRIKFCGMMRAEDAVAAARVGADAVGMVLHSNTARKISVAQARQIMDALPALVTPVGLFVDCEIGPLLQITQHLHLRHIQLHGHETPQMVAEMKGLAIIKAIRVDLELRETLSLWRTEIARLELTNLKGILLETAGHGPGGTGAVNDWGAIAAALRTGMFDGLPPLIAAGGLTPENVRGVIQQLRPFAVDVSSGIESSPGVKSVEKMRAFTEAVQSADLSTTV